MRKRLWSFLAVWLMAVSIMFAQNVVSGIVYEAETGDPVIGASVVVKEAAGVGAATDIDGKFTVKDVPVGGKTLVVSYIGMETKEVPLKSYVKIYMESTSRTLDEQIVVAYGTQSRHSFTGAATTVKGESIRKMQVSSVERAFEGAVAGVQLSSASNTPGSEASIIIRGIGSVSSSQEPLIVLDGVPYEGSLNSINPKDIATLTVLKDAAANSMYGARGANGVIMITTKNGGRGKAQIDFDARLGVNTRGVGNYNIITDDGQWYKMMWESYRNLLQGYYGEDANAIASENLIPDLVGYNSFVGVADNELVDENGQLNPAAKTRKWSDNWRKDPFKSKLRQEYNLSISGGNEDTQAYASIGYLNDKGYVVGSGFDRFTGRVKVDQKVNKWIKVGGNISYARTDQKFYADYEGSDSYNNLFMFSQLIAPVYPIYFYDEEGKRALNASGGIYDFGAEYGRTFGAETNPYAEAAAGEHQVLRDNFSSRGYAEFTLPYGFKVTANMAYDLFNTNTNDFYTPIGGDAAAVNGRGERSSQRYQAFNANLLIDWNKTFGNHGIHVLLGHENKKDHSKYLGGGMANFVSPYNSEFATAGQYESLTSYSTEYALEGVFAKGEYNYLDRYYFTASIRRDGSSRFAKGNRWGTFWAVGGAWRIKEEPWMKEISVIDDLKLKASYGTQGNDNVGYAHNYTNLYNVGRTHVIGGEPAVMKANYGNPDLTWEKSRNFNIGFESSFLRRFTLDFDFFVKETRDMLYYSPLMPSDGMPDGIYRNEMNMRNTGFEFTLGADIIKTKDFKWNVSLNGMHYKNKLTKLPVSKRDKSIYPDGYQAGDYWRSVGGSLYDWYLYEYVGVDPETGMVQYNAYEEMTPEEWNGLSEEEKAEYEDYNAKTGEARYIVNSEGWAAKRRIGKSPFPSFVGGLSTSLEWKGIDFSIQTAFQLGGWVLDNNYASLMQPGDNGMNFHKDMLNRWTPENTQTNIPALMMWDTDSYRIAYNSDFFLTKASYFSLRNITLGYTFPKKLLSAAGIEKLRVYFSGDNVWLHSKRKGFDPRMNDGGAAFGGSSGFGYAALSSYSIGVNLSF
ncbi:MAG: TonB-dependent receptor [Bacteroidaceae bacterium]|nr:TonB-dependent receptor [Bacteroidaceae bacterium]